MLEECTKPHIYAHLKIRINEIFKDNPEEFELRCTIAKLQNIIEQLGVQSTSSSQTR